MNVIIMRGIPGAGKSTWAHRNTPSDTLICSADNYFVDDLSGEYRFNPKDIGKAHDWCFSSFLHNIRDPKLPAIVVDNTNLQSWEISPYYRVAETSGMNVKIVTVFCSFKIAALRNVHGVPLDKVWSMFQTLQSERLPPQWKHEVVFSEAPITLQPNQ